LKYYVLLYENKEMRSVETIPGTGGRGINKKGGGGEFNYDKL
jgi:hypothetical protein